MTFIYNWLYRVKLDVNHQCQNIILVSLSCSLLLNCIKFHSFTCANSVITKYPKGKQYIYILYSKVYSSNSSMKFKCLILTDLKHFTYKIQFSSIIIIVLAKAVITVGGGGGGDDWNYTEYEIEREKGRG